MAEATKTKVAVLLRALLIFINFSTSSIINFYYHLTIKRNELEFLLLKNGGERKVKYKFMDPEVIMSVVVALIILAVGVFAFFVTIQNIPTTEPTSTTSQLENATYYAITNVSKTGDSVFNIVGIVLIIGAIMTIIGLVYSYMRPRY